MPVVNPSSFDRFFKTKVVKRKGLLKEGAEKEPWESSMKSRIPSSSVESMIYYTGEMKTARNGIVMISFNSIATNGSEGVVVFNWSWSKIQAHLGAISVYRDYLNRIGSTGASLFYTATISQVYRWSNNPDNEIVTQELRDVIQYLFSIDKISSAPSEAVRNVIGNKMLDLTGITNARKDILNSITKTLPVTNPKALTDTILRDIKSKFSTPNIKDVSPGTLKFHKSNKVKFRSKNLKFK